MSSGDGSPARRPCGCPSRGRGRPVRAGGVSGPAVDGTCWGGGGCFEPSPSAPERTRTARTEIRRGRRPGAAGVRPAAGHGGPQERHLPRGPPPWHRRAEEPSRRISRPRSRDTGRGIADLRMPRSRTARAAGALASRAGGRRRSSPPRSRRIRRPPSVRGLGGGGRGRSCPWPGAGRGHGAFRIPAGTVSMRLQAGPSSVLRSGPWRRDGGPGGFRDRPLIGDRSDRHPVGAMAGKGAPASRRGRALGSSAWRHGRRRPGQREPVRVLPPRRPAVTAGDLPDRGSPCGRRGPGVLRVLADGHAGPEAATGRVGGEPGAACPSVAGGPEREAGSTFCGCAMPPVPFVPDPCRTGRCRLNDAKRDAPGPVRAGPLSRGDMTIE